MGKERLCRRGLGLLAAGLYVLAIFFCRSAEPEAKKSRFLLNQSIDAATAEDIFTREQALPEPVGFCFWGEAGVKTVSCPETGGTSRVTTVCLSGNPELLDAGVLAWQDGCLLDTDTAQTLFGTADCGGQTLLMDGKIYRVLGTFSGLQSTIVTKAEDEHGAILSRCILSPPAPQSGQTGENFLLRHNLQGTAIDVYSLWILLRNWLVLCPLLPVLADLHRRRKNFREKANWLPLAVESLAVLFLWRQIEIPASFLPDQWSDFSFWGRLWDFQKGNWYRLLLTSLGQRHLQMMGNMVKSMITSTAAFLLAAGIRRRHRHADTADRR